MRAMVVPRFGPPEVFERHAFPDREPGAGEVLVAVAAISVLWLETSVRRGDGQDYWPMRPPYVPGSGVAGTVLAAGEGVDPAWVGALVTARTDGEGGYADRLIARADTLSRVPDGVDLVTAAGALHDATTALGVAEATGLGPADRVVVLGASGGLGLLLVQLARSRAKSVVAVARGAEKVARVGELGPDAVLDSSDPSWPEALRDLLPGGQADVVLDGVGGALGERAFELLAPEGRFSAHGTPSGRFAQVGGARVITIGDYQYAPGERTARTSAALQAVADGEITPIVGQTYPLEDAAAAHAAIEARTVFGKTVLLP